MNNLFNINLKKSWVISRLNLRRLKVVPIVMLALFIALDIQSVIQSVTMPNLDNSTIAGIDALMLCCIFIPIFLATSSFYKTMRLGVKKKDYFWGALICMAFTAVLIALICMLTFYILYTPLMKMNTMYGWWPLFDVFGFAANGFFVGFLQMFGFLFFVSVFVFMLSSLQDKWIGWTLDALIIAGISVFSSVRVCRKYIWGPFFKALIFGYPALQILFTVFGGLALYFLYLPILKQKKI